MQNWKRLALGWERYCVFAYFGVLQKTHRGGTPKETFQTIIKPFKKISATPQIVSLASGFVCLSLASSKLFYSQRLGILSNVDPSLGMLGCILPFTFVLILGPIFCLSLIASYSPKFAFVLVVIITLSQIACTKFVYYHGKAAQSIIGKFL